MSTPTYRTLTPIFDELHDERIIVSPYHEDDAEDLFDAINESREHIRPWLPFADKHQNIEETRDWINSTRAQWLLRENFSMGIWEKESVRFLGGIGLHPRVWEIGYFEIGYWLRSSAEGHGYMVAAAQLLVEYAFASLNAQRLAIRCDERNTRSAAVARRLGFTQEACLRHDSCAPDGSLRNTLIFGRLPDESIAMA
ncbi:MAG: GNAT family N-acetyltransferase [Ktedonobacteraceae bacterium]